MQLIEIILITVVVITSAVLAYFIHRKMAFSRNLHKIINKYKDFSCLSIEEQKKAKSELAEVGITGEKASEYYMKECLVYNIVAILLASTCISFILISFLGFFIDKIEPDIRSSMVAIVLFIGMMKFIELLKIAKINHYLSILNSR